MELSRRVYNVHIRKVGGRSIHHGFFALAGGDPKATYLHLAKSPGRVVDIGAFKIGGWLSNLSQPFDYAFSHQPVYRLKGLDDDILAFTCFRDPVQRIVSHWKMLREYINGRALGAPVHPGLEPEIDFFSDDIVKFAETMPAFHRLNQLYMFSETGNLPQAVASLGRMNLILETADIDGGLDRLFAMLGRTRPPIQRIGVATITKVIDPDTEEKLRALVADEYLLLAAARQMKTHYTNAPTPGVVAG